MMVVIKALTSEDADWILEFESKHAPKLPVYYPYDREALDSYIFKNKDGKAFGAFDKDLLVGWAGYSCKEKAGEVDKGVYEMSGLVVHSNYRRQGIGLKLFKARMEDLLSKPGLKRIYATNYPLNSPIIILYLTNGFVIYDFKKDCFGPGIDRLFLKYEKLG
jgi:GNAT superfamily N-acetyltransferase